MHADAGGNGSSSGKGEDDVQEVKHRQDEGPCERSNEVRKNAVKRGRENSKRSSEHTKVHLGVGLVGAGGKGSRQTEGNDKENKVDNAQDAVTDSQHDVCDVGVKN